MTLVTLVIIALLLGGYLALCVVMALLQDTFIYAPQHNADHAQLARWHDLRLLVPGAFGPLEAWLLRRDQLDHSPLLLYCGGNAEDASWALDDLLRFHDGSILAVNYRGYGTSAGVPREAGIKADVLAVIDHLHTHFGIRRPLVMGRSLGSGVAMHLAAHRAVAGAVLITPYDSILALARSRMPWLPVRLMLHDRWDSLALAPAITCPVLVVLAGRDRMVPPTRGRHLASALKHVEILDRPAADHVDIWNDATFIATTRRFLASCVERDQPSPL